MYLTVTKYITYKWTNFSSLNLHYIIAYRPPAESVGITLVQVLYKHRRRWSVHQNLDFRGESELLDTSTRFFCEIMGPDTKSIGALDQVLTGGFFSI